MYNISAAVLSHWYYLKCPKCLWCHFLFQESLSISAAASEKDEAAPTLIVKESFEGEVSEVFLVSEKVVLCKIDPPKSPLFLFAAFYAFNMQYPKGLVSLYTFLEIFLFNKRPKKIPSIVSSILSCLNTTNWTVTIIMLSIMHIQIFFHMQLLYWFL